MLSPRGECCLAGSAVALMGVVMASVVPASAQPLLVSKQPLPVSNVAAFRVESTLVLVPVTVLDRRGAVVDGLAGDAFTVSEDGVPQPIRSFSEDDAPVSIGIVLDLSGSMKEVLLTAKEALCTLLKDANPGDEAFLNTVSTRPRAYLGFTRDLDDIVSRAAVEQAGGDTALIDSLYDSLRELRAGVHPRRALVVISDGMDNHSRHSKAELLEEAMETDAQVYTIAIAGVAPGRKPIAEAEEKRGRLFLDEVSARTGGLSFVAGGRTDIARAAACIGRALRNQYTIGYLPHGDGGRGKWRKIKVTVVGSGMRVYARNGYRSE